MVWIAMKYEVKVTHSAEKAAKKWKKSGKYLAEPNIMPTFALGSTIKTHHPIDERRQRDKIALVLSVLKGKRQRNLIFRFNRLLGSWNDHSNCLFHKVLADFCHINCWMTICCVFRSLPVQSVFQNVSCSCSYVHAAKSPINAPIIDYSLQLP